MHFITKASVLAFATLAAVSEASPHALHHSHRRWWFFGGGEDETSVDPVPSPSFPSIPSASLSTGFTYPGPAPTGGSPDPTVTSEPVPVSSETITLSYTLGPGSSTTVITTIISRPVTSDPAATPTEPGETSAGEETTTLSFTSTTTEYITVTPVGPGQPGESGYPGGPDASCVPVTVTATETSVETVTETETSVKTVTVTAGNPEPTGEDGKPGDGDDDDEGDDDEKEDDDDDDSQV